MCGRPRVDGWGLGGCTQDPKGRYHPRWQYVRSLVWLRAVITLLALYAIGLSILYVLFSRLPSLDTLSGVEAWLGGVGGGEVQ